MNLTLALLHNHLGCNFQYSVCFLFSVTDLDWVGEHSSAVPLPAESCRIFQPKKNNRNFAFSNRNGTMENVHFEMEAQQKNICIFKSNPSCRDLRCQEQGLGGQPGSSIGCQWHPPLANYAAAANEPLWSTPPLSFSFIYSHFTQQKNFVYRGAAKSSALITLLQGLFSGYVQNFIDLR